MRAVVTLCCLAACTGGGNHHAGADATTDAAATDAAATDAAATDAAATDAAATDAAPLAGCPVRTVPPGQPQGTVPAAAIHDGDYTIYSPLDVQALAGIRVITGSLTVSVPSFSELSLPDLEVIGRNFFIYDWNAALQHVSLPELQTIGASAQLSMQAATQIDVPMLDDAGVELIIATSGTAPLSLPCLRSVTNGLQVSNAAAPTLALPALAQVGTLELQHDALTSVSLPSLTDLGGIDIEQDAQLASISAPLVTHAAGDLVVASCPALTTLDLGALTDAGAVDLSDLGLADLAGLRSLARVSRLAVSGLPSKVISLPALQHAATLQLGPLAAVTSLAAPALASSATSITLGQCEALTQIDMGALTDAASLTLDDVGVVDLGGFGALASVDSLTVTSMPRMTSMTLPATLQQLGALDLENDGALRSFAAPTLQLTAGDITMKQCAALTTIDLPGLTQTGNLTLRAIGVVDLAGFAALTTAVSLDIEGDASLAHLGLDALTTLGAPISTIASDPLLPTCEVTALATRIGHAINHPGDGNGTCP